VTSDLPRGFPESGKRMLSVGIIGGTGAVLAAFEIWHTFHMQTLPGKLLEAILPLVVAMVILYASHWLWHSEFDDRATLRMTGWFIAGVIAITAVVGWIVAHQFVRGGEFHHWHFMTAGSMTVGGTAGFLLGVYDERSRRRRESLLVERKRVEAKQAKLTLLNRVLRHNILNAMNVIRGRAEMHTERTDGDGHRELDVIVTRSDDIVDLIEKVHTFIERVSNDGDPDLKPIDLAAVLEDEIENTRRAYPQAEVSADVPTDVRVLADEMLAEAFENLVMNAVEHNDKEKPVVTVSIEDQEDATVVSVVDNGPGIPDDEKESLFEWNPEVTSRPAMGVGLSLVETLIDQYGGSIWIEDNTPEGSIFRVTLPGPDDQRSPATAGR